MEQGDRSFEIHSVKHGKTMMKFNPGRYISKTPSGAARKMFFNVSDGKKRVLVITCKETTRGSNGKSYTYKVSRVKNDTDVVLDGKQVVFKYSTKTKAV